MKKLNLLVLSGIFFSKESIYFENKIKFENQEKGLWEVLKTDLCKCLGFTPYKALLDEMYLILSFNRLDHTRTPLTFILILIPSNN